MKSIFLALILAGLFITAGIVFSPKNTGTEDGAPINSVSIVDGTQFINLTAKGGYTPKKSVAQAGIPTILRFTTKGTFDCSAALRIPSLDISANLTPSGTKEIDIGSPEAGVLQGTCGMGMYPFEIEFQK
ncbi:MAG: cupredoxin domain-containing protein [Patescibacteria group bacterium]